MNCVILAFPATEEMVLQKKSVTEYDPECMCLFCASDESFLVAAHTFITGPVQMFSLFLLTV